MAQKTKKMTIKYWESLSAGSKKRALQYVFCIHPAIVEMLMNEKPDLKSEWWKMVFTKVRIPATGSYYKTVVNNTYLN
jgi:Fe-S oxidoreductase